MPPGFQNPGAGNPPGAPGGVPIPVGVQVPQQAPQEAPLAVPGFNAPAPAFDRDGSDAYQWGVYAGIGVIAALVITVVLFAVKKALAVD
jgi:hypothetical protein